MNYESKDMSKVEPYKGLMPYSEKDAPFFFGRNSEREIITNNLMASRLTLLYGESGVGKSSVLRAGVAHNLRQKAKQSLSNSGIPEFAIVVFPPLEADKWSWRDDPIVGLGYQIEADIRAILNGNQFESIEPSSSLVETIKVWANRLGEKDETGEIFIILDQFEEYFLYHGREDGEGTFAVEFPRIFREPDLHINFLISIREDSLAKLDHFKGRIPKLFSNYLRIKQLNVELARDAIVKPIEEYNRQQKLGKTAIYIESEMVDEVLAQVKRGKLFLPETGLGGVDLQLPTPSAVQIETPLLQLVMIRLWKQMRKTGSHNLQLRTLNQLGGAEKIIKEHLNDQLNSLPESEQDLAARVFQYLVTPGGSKIAYPVLDLAEPMGIDEGKLKLLLENLARGERRIIRLMGSPTKPDILYYEIFHDVLARPILMWRMQYLQRKKLIEERHQRTLTIKQGLSAQSMRWRGQRQDEVSALLARQAFLFNQRDQCGVLDQVDEALREVLSLPDFSNILQGHGAAVFCVAFSPDSTLLASSSDDQTVRLWTLNNPGDPPAVLKHYESKVYSVAFSPDGHLLATGSGDAKVYLWNLHDLNAPPIILKHHKSRVDSVAFSQNGKMLASGSWDATVQLLDLYDLKASPTILKHNESHVHSVAFSPDGNMLAAGRDNKTVQLWNPHKPSASPTILDAQSSVNSVAFSPDGQLLASGGWDKSVRLWKLNQLNVSSGVVLEGHQLNAPNMVLKGHQGVVRAVVFMPNNSPILASSGDDQTVRLWNLRRPNNKPKILRGQYFAISSVAFSPNGKLLASGSWDSTIRLQQVQQHPLIPELLEHQQQVNSVAFSSKRALLASGSKDNTVRLWDLRHPHEEPKVLQGHEKCINGVEFSPDGRFLVSASNDKTLRLWLLNHDNEEVKVLAGHELEVSSVAISPDGKMLASGSRDCSVRLWDLHQQETLSKVLGRHDQGVTSVAFSPDGIRLASGSEDNTIRLWHLDQPDTPLAIFIGHENVVTSVAFSPDGDRLASCSYDKTVRLWDLNHLDSEPRIFEGHSYWCASVAFSPDGKTLASGSYDWTIRLWDLTGLNSETILLRDHKQSVTSVAFSPDGKTLASGSYDNTVLLWRVRTQDLAEMVCKKVQRNLTVQEWIRFMGRDIPYEQTCPNLPGSVANNLTDKTAP